MIRLKFIEMVRREIYNGQPSDDASITIGLVNAWIEPAVGVAARANYIDNSKLDGIAYVNNSFYTTFKNLAVVSDELFLWKITLPEIPVGIGSNEGVSTLKFRGYNSEQLSTPVIWLTENQRTFQQSMRDIPNKIVAYPEGNFVYAESTILLDQYTANVTMISGGNSTDLNSILNVPPDYFPIMTKYIIEQLMIEFNQPVDAVNDGLDAKTTT